MGINRLTYTVSFFRNEGSTDEIPVIKTVILPAVYVDPMPDPPSRTGYYFDEWNTHADGTGTVFDETTPVSGNISVYAQWISNAGGDDGLPLTVNRNIPEARSVFANPDRGWYQIEYTNKASASALTRLRNDGLTLILFETDLSSFLTEPLSPEKINEISNAFSMARTAGMSVIYRAAYDFTGQASPEPEDINIILNHISQLKPVLHANEDVLYCVQAGFLGPWGEWHSSHFGGNNINQEIRQMVVDALLDAVPASVTVALRVPQYIRNAAGAQTVTRAEAFGNSKIARISFHNDALMADETDMGTFIDRNYSREAELTWINQQTRYTPMVGEVNRNTAYSDIPAAMEYLDRVNIESVNMDYLQAVMDKWKSAQYGGMSAYDYIGMMMGYRFVLKSTGISQAAPQGGIIRVDLELTNTGFGNLLKEKKFELVLKKGNQTYSAAIAEDPRFWEKNELISRSYYFRLPSNIAVEDWDVYLGLISVFDPLCNNPAYSVRFSNTGIWDPALGLNRIGKVSVTASENSVSGKEFIQIIP